MQRVSIGVLITSLSAVALLAACGGTGNTNTMGDMAMNPTTLPDGFLTTCRINSDCDDSNKCTDDRCSSQTCSNLPVDCAGVDDECNVGMCNSKTGDCDPEPANEGAACAVGSTMPGHCVAGSCAPDPQCEIETFLSCTFSLSDTWTTVGATNAISDYTCAAGETGPEVAYEFEPNFSRRVTVSLTGTTADLDLIVLESPACAAAAPCRGQSLTVGSGNESVTFDAVAGTTYIFVVDSKGATSPYTISVDCQSCNPVSTLACNQTISGDTTAMSATNIFSDYGSFTVCATGLAGPEQTYKIPSGDTLYNISVTGLTQDHDLIVVDEESTDKCDASWCNAQSVTTGTGNEMLSITGSSFSAMYLMVDSRSTGGPYQLEVSCPPQCRNNTNETSCDSAGAATSFPGNRINIGANDDAAFSRDLVDTWGGGAGACAGATTETGPEVVYTFSPDIAGMYTFTLSGLTANLDLIVLEQNASATCDPTTACVAASTNAGNADDSVTFLGDITKTYYIAVDGKSNAVSRYSLAMTTTPCTGAVPQCANSNLPIGCGANQSRMVASSAGAGSTDLITRWGSSPSGVDGNEMVHLFQPTTTADYTITISGLTGDLDAAVFETLSTSVCDSSTRPLDTSTSTSTTETLTFRGVSGRSYWVAVDGYSGASSPYTIAITAGCP